MTLSGLPILVKNNATCYPSAMFLQCFLPALAQLFLSTAGAALPPANPTTAPAPLSATLPDRWELSDEVDGIKVFKQEIEGSEVLAFKGEAVIDSPLERVATVIFDTSRAPEWVVDLAQSRLVRWINENEFIEYDHVRTPPIIMKDRDFVSRVHMTIDREKGQMKFVYGSTEDASIPETSHIRGDLKNTTFTLTSIEGGTKTHLVGSILADPKGGVPKWIVNFFQKGWPIDTIRNLRRQAAKADVKVDPVIAAKLAPAPTSPPSGKSGKPLI